MIAKINQQNAGALITYAQRYPMEYQMYMVSTLRNLREKARADDDDKVYTRCLGALRVPEAVQWMQQYADEML